MDIFVECLIYMDGNYKSKFVSISYSSYSQLLCC